MSCQTPTTFSSRILEALPDFVLTGSGQARFTANGELDVDYISPHDITDLSRPSLLQIGVQYIFHYGGSTNNETLAIKVLPERLASLGFKVIKSPKSSADFSYPAFSGPLFSIHFSDGNHTGLIYNRVDNKLSGSHTFKNEDYLLVILK